MKASVFIVEDEGLIALDLETSLERDGFDVRGIADSADEALEAIANTLPDLVLMDIRIKGERDGIWTANEIRRRFDIPVVFVTAHGDEQTLERARVAEPYGFVVKPFIGVNFRSHLQTIIWKHSVQALVRAERAWLASTLDRVGGGVLSTDAQGDVAYMNGEAERLTGFSAREGQGLPLLEVLPIYDEQTGLPVVSPIHCVQQGRDPSPDVKLYHLSSERTEGVLTVEANITVNRDASGLLGLIVVFRDVTAECHRVLRERQRERLQAVEALAYGLARDLSEMLKTQVSYVDTLAARVPAELKGLAEAAHQSSIESLEWAAQLDELGLQQMAPAVALDLNPIIREVVRDPQTALVGAWTCILDLSAQGAPVVTDPEACRRNLRRTLREMRKAMPRGGTIRISTWSRDGEVVLCIRDDERRARHGAVNRVFDPYQFPPNRVRRSNGLALTLLYHYMGLTGGAVECTGDGPGESMALTLHFPAADRLAVPGGLQSLGAASVHA